MARMSHVAPRLHVLLAAEAPLGVVIRRGPSKRVATFLWDRRTDAFQLGQWLNGRIYERRSDLSPDGKHFLYFAMNGRWETEARGSWTAVSRAPFLKALALFPKGDCWYGGGLFTGSHTYWLNDGGGHAVLRDTKAVRRDRRYRPAGNYGGECPGVYFHRLIRDGWTYHGRVSLGGGKDQDVFDKPAPDGWVLRKIAHAEVGAPVGKGCYWDEHELVHPARDAVIRRPQWEWAEVDGKRLVWAAEGRLFAGTPSPAGPANVTELFDFGAAEYVPVAAPY